MTRSILIASCALFLAGCGGHVIYPSEAYEGTVVDAETGRPLTDAVVIAIWYRETNLVVAHGPAVDYHDSYEALTDGAGRFEIPARTHFTLLGGIRQPRFVVYSPGYASFPSLKAKPSGGDLEQAYAQHRVDFRLTKLTNREERMRNTDHPIGTTNLPQSQTLNLRRLLNAERQALGLEPYTPR
jgi:hypothetical protein